MNSSVQQIIQSNNVVVLFYFIYPLLTNHPYFYFFNGCTPFFMLFTTSINTIKVTVQISGGFRLRNTD